jgi:predicted nucleic acid-binding protein
VLTFVDSGVLIAASRGIGDVGRRALEVLDDPARTYASSVFVRLEVLPKPLFYKRRDEADFYRSFFAGVSRWAEPISSVARRAHSEGVKNGLSAIDAPHVAAAIVTGADELVTTERASSPLCRVKSVAVRTIRS